MDHLRIGPIEVLMGERESRIPYSTSLLIKGKDGDGLLDCGAGFPVFDYLKREHHVRDVYITHYHLDHVWGLSHFPGVQTWVNEKDLAKLSDREELLKANGYYAILGEREAKRLFCEEGEREGHSRRPRLSWRHLLAAPKSTYPYDREMEIAGTSVIMLHAPGHCEGFCCPYFPKYGVLHVGDFDLTSFGPWYNNADSDIDDMVDSAQRTLLVDADSYVTSHQKGVIPRSDYRRLLGAYMSTVERRDERVLQAVRKGVPPERLLDLEVFYLQKNLKQSPGLLAFEKMGIAKHLKRLIKHGEPIHDYFQSFLAVHGIHGEYVEYRHAPAASTPQTPGETKRLHGEEST